MNGWKYRARTPDGDVITGVVQAISEEDAMRAVVRRKLIPEDVSPAAKEKAFELRRRPDSKALTLFTRKMATLIDAAVPLVTSLEVLESLAEDRVLKAAIRDVRASIQAGASLSDALRRHPKVFSDIYVNMIEAGEQGGVLDVVLRRLADYLEKSESLKSKVKTAMVYPSIILFVAVAAVIVMLTFVIPTFQEMFEGAGLELPWPTLVLVRSSAFLREQWAPLAAGGLSLFVLGRRFYEAELGRKVFDRMILKVPILGDVVRKAAIARFCRSVASLLSAGMHLLETLEAGARSTGNILIEQAILRSKPAIASGRGIAEPLIETGVVPELVAKMVQVGEETGRLDEMFGKVADFYEEEVEAAVERLMKSLEPAMIVLVGTILGGMVVAMYLPIFQALTSVA